MCSFLFLALPEFQWVKVQHSGAAPAAAPTCASSPSSPGPSTSCPSCATSTCPPAHHASRRPARRPNRRSISTSRPTCARLRPHRARARSGPPARPDHRRLRAEPRPASSVGASSAFGPARRLTSWPNLPAPAHVLPWCGSCQDNLIREPGLATLPTGPERRLDFLSLTGLPHAPRRSTFPPSPPATRSAPR